jgi:protoporphyrinogen IX oxidase
LPRIDRVIETLKALHVVGFVVWLAGMLVTPAILAARPEPATVAALRRWALRITTPAMLATLAIGLWMAQSTGWFAAAWLQAKLAAVVILTAIHGMQSGQLRRLATEPGYQLPRWAGRLPWVVLGLVSFIAVLATTKPVPW